MGWFDFWNWFSSESNEQRNFYGWRRDKPDHRDLKHDFHTYRSYSTTKVCDLRENCPEVYNQGNLGSCTSQAIAGAFQFDEMKQKLPEFHPSRLFIYYNEREIEGTVNVDAGAEIRDGIKSINKQGVCEEELWVYDISKFAQKPTDKCYKDGLNHLSVEYRRVDQRLDQMKTCLDTGLPFVLGFSVYSSFESDIVKKTGMMPMPKKDESVLGGHAVLCVGYNDQMKRMIVRNSWGEDWGDSGYFYMPYEFISNSNFAADFWTIQKVANKEVKELKKEEFVKVRKE